MGRIRKAIWGGTTLGLGVPLVNLRNPTEKNTREIKRLRSDQQRQHAELLDAIQGLSIPSFQPAEDNSSGLYHQSSQPNLDDEEVMALAIEQIVKSGQASTSMLQRKCGIGFARAERLMKSLEELGVVGPEDRKKKREVLWTEKDLESD